FYINLARQPASKLFPYTTLFRSTFTHRWSFEFDGTAWDGGQVRVSRNGGPFTTNDIVFSQNGYNGAVQSSLYTGVSDLHGQSALDRKSTRLNSSHEWISYAVFCL